MSMNVFTFHDHTAHDEGEEPLAQLTLSSVQWCHLQLEATLFFLQSPIFSVCYHYIIPPPPWIKSSRYLPVCSIHPTCWTYIPYLRWIALAAGSIVPADIEKEAQAPLVIWCPVGSSYFQGTLVSFCLLSIMCVFLSVAGIWLQDATWDAASIVLLSFPFFYPYLSFYKQENSCS